MAEINLNSTTPLKIVIVPLGKTYNGTGNPGIDAGTFLFDEGTETIKVNNKLYHGFTPAQKTLIDGALTQLVNSGILTSTTTDGVTSYSNAVNKSWIGKTAEVTTLSDLFDSLADSISDIEHALGSTGESSIASQIATLSGQISDAQQDAHAAMRAAQAAQTSADNAMQAANNRVQSVSAQASQTLVTVTTSGTGPYSVTVGAGTDLSSAVNAANTAVQTVTLQGATGNLFTTNSGTAVSGSIDGTKVLVGNSSAGETASAYSTSTISAAIDALNAAIDTLGGDASGESLSTIIAQINEIKQELQAEGEGTPGTDLTATLLDTLRTLKLRTSSSEYKGWDKQATGTVQAPTPLQTSLDNLADYADSQSQAAQTAAQNYAAAQASAAQTAAETYAAAQASAAQATAIQATNDAKAELLGATGTSGNTIISAKADAANALAAAQAAAGSHSTVQGVTGATAGSTNYVMVTETIVGTGTTTQHKDYTVKSTEALDTALNNLNTAAQNAMQAAQSAITWEVVS